MKKNIEEKILFLVNGDLHNFVDPNNVRKVKCSTCPFGNTPLGVELGSEAHLSLVSQLTEWAINNSNRICHHEQLRGKSSEFICRGARDIQLSFYHASGVLAQPTDSCWEQTLNLSKYRGRNHE